MGLLLLVFLLPLFLSGEEFVVFFLLLLLLPRLNLRKTRDFSYLLHKPERGCCWCQRREGEVVFSTVR